MITTTTAHTTREIIFTMVNRDRVVVETRRFPAGTEIYVGKTRSNNETDIRVAGTLFTQAVYTF
jgi:hypothetical protein